MAGSSFELRSGDIRPLAKSLDAKSKEITAGFAAIYNREFALAEDDLRRRVGSTRLSATTVKRRTGEFARTVGSNVDHRTYSVRAELGFLNAATDRELQKISAHVQETDNEDPFTIIKPKTKTWLAFPPRDDAHPEIRDNLGRQLMNARDLRSRGFSYFFLEKDEDTLLIIGRKRKKGTKRKRGKIGPKTVGAKTRGRRINHDQLLFILKKVVVLPKRINLAQIRANLLARIEDRQQEFLARVLRARR